MSAYRIRFTVLAAIAAASLALPAAAEDAHHPPTDSAKPPAAQPAQPAAPGGMMGNMMQMMHQMMSGMQNSGAMHRMRMMGMGGMGMMEGSGVARVEGHIAFVKAELKITPAQEPAWNAYAAALRANAKQLNALAAELTKAPASPMERLAQQEKTLAARLEIVRRTHPAMAALHAALADDQKKTFGELAVPRGRMGMH